MSIWFKDYPLELINKSNKGTMVENCGIELIEITENSLIGTMPADSRNHQPYGILHGGANCVLAETLGSIAANLTCDPEKTHGVGLSITTNHIKAVRNGLVKGIATATHLGRTTQVWDITTYNSVDQITSKTSLTVAIVSKLGRK